MPESILDKWRALPTPQRTAAEHDKLLAPYLASGSFVCSDSAGLSKLSKTFPLVHVLKLVAEPKEIIYAYGAAIGGQPVGTWVADNTQMWYPDEIPVGLVIVQMLAAQREIVRRCKLQVGLGVGCSAGLPLYRIGSGLYGAVLDEMEDFTEEESHAGEVNLSPAAWGAARALRVASYTAAGMVTLRVRVMQRLALDRFAVYLASKNTSAEERLYEQGNALVRLSWTEDAARAEFAGAPPRVTVEYDKATGFLHSVGVEYCRRAAKR